MVVERNACDYCGDVNLWKPSSKVPLSAIAVQNILKPVIETNNLPEGLFC